MPDKIENYNNLFQDFYFQKDGYKEADYVFIKANNIDFNKDFTIGELGYGTGLNLVVLLDRAFKNMQKININYYSIELYPLSYERVYSLLECFLDESFFLQEYLNLYKNFNLNKDHFNIKLKIKNVFLNLNIYLKDVLIALNDFNFKINHWFLDGFKPKTNPEMWSYEVLSLIYKNTMALGSFSTFSSKGELKRTLIDLGFKVEKIKGFNKRHMLKGIKI